MPKPTKGPRLGGGPSHQRKILANLAASLIEEERITPRANGETVTFHLYAVSGTGDGPIFVDREGTDAPDYGFYNDPSHGPHISVTYGGDVPPVIGEVSPDPAAVTA